MSNEAGFGDPEGFARRLRRDRLAAGLTQEELAERSGLSVRAISDLERGRTAAPRHSTRRQIATVLAGACAPPGSAAGQALRIPARPAELPAEVADFTGRQDESGRLAGLLSEPAGGMPSSGVAVVAVTGAGGIGKTALALHAAHQFAPLFRDAQLYLNLRGSGPQPLPPAEGLARFLRDLGIAAADVPADEDERAARYRSLTAGMRLVVLLDDARDAAQVRPLLPGTGKGGSCVVLVTSRNWMQGLEPARVLELGALAEADAAALFSKIVGEGRVAAEPEAARRVLAACAGLPLAIRIAASRLAARPSWAVAVLADRLADERQRLSELAAGDLAVRASFRVSYDNLPALPVGGSAPAKRAFRMLSLADGPDVSLPAAAALLDCGAADAERALEHLVDGHLVESPAPGRYRFHDLLRMFAAECALAEDDAAARRQAIRRMLRWYLNTAVAACRAISPHRDHPGPGQAADDAAPLAFADRRGALDWLDAEHANLMLAVSQAAREGEHEIAWQLPFALWDLFNLRGRFGDWLAVHQTGLASARLLRDTAAEKYLLGNLAANYVYVGQPHQALGCMEQILTIVRDTGDRHDIGTALVNLGVTLTDLGQLGRAMNAMQEALQILLDVGDLARAAFAYCGIAAIHARCGRSDQALAYYRRGVETFTANGDVASLGETLADMAEVHASEHQPDQAIAIASEAVRVCRQSGSRRNEARALAVLGRAHRERGEPERAAQYWHTAIAIFCEIGHPQADQLADDLQALRTVS